MIYILPRETLPAIPQRICDALREPEDSIYQFLTNIYLQSDDCLVAYDQIHLALTNTEWLDHTTDENDYGFKEAFDDLMMLYDQMVGQLRRFLEHYENLNGFRVVSNEIDVKPDGVYIDVVIEERTPHGSRLERAKLHPSDRTHR